MPHDFTSIKARRFEYTVDSAAGQPQTVSLDFDRIGLDLQLSIPFALKVMEGETLKDGLPKIGLHAIWEVYSGERSEESLPKKLPNLSHFEFAVCKAFRIPDHLADNPTIVLAIIGAWISEQAEILALKKNTPDSPGSPAPTPEASSLPA